MIKLLVITLLSIIYVTANPVDNKDGAFLNFNDIGEQAKDLGGKVLDKAKDGIDKAADHFAKTFSNFGGQFSNLLDLKGKSLTESQLNDLFVERGLDKIGDKVLYTKNVISSASDPKMIDKFEELRPADDATQEAKLNFEKSLKTMKLCKNEGFKNLDAEKDSKSYCCQAFAYGKCVDDANGGGNELAIIRKLNEQPCVGVKPTDCEKDIGEQAKEFGGKVLDKVRDGIDKATDKHGLALWYWIGGIGAAVIALLACLCCCCCCRGRR